MDSMQRAHVEQLLQLNRAHLRELETQQAKLGILAPSGIAVQLAEYQRTIDDLERQLAEALPCHNLPPHDYERFVGRQQQLEEVRRLLLPYPKSRHHLVTIDGIGGIGKSALALETAYQARDSYAALPEAERFEAIVWVSAKRTYLTADGILEQRQAFRALDDLYAAIAQVLDYPAITRAPAEEQRAIVERVLSEQRTLLILDNLETVDDEELLIFLRLLPDPTKAIVTTRHRIDVAYPVRLLGMPQADALALIDQEATRKDVALAPAEQDQLFARTGGVPLAIVWSIGLMGLGGSVESVLRRLGSGQSDIARFCFDESVAQIRGRDAHKLLLALSLFATDASREALGIVAGLGQDEFGRDLGLEELLRLSLINKEGERFSLLPLTNSFVQADGEKQRTWMDGAIERWQIFLHNVVRAFGRGFQHWQEYNSFDLELTNVLSMIDYLVTNLKYQNTTDGNLIINSSSIEPARKIIEISGSVARRSRYRGCWAECESVCHTSIKLGNVLQDFRNVARRILDLSLISSYRGDLQKASDLALEAFRIASNISDVETLGIARLRLSSIEIGFGHIERASTFIKAAYNDRAVAKGRGSLPLIMEGMGELEESKGNISDAINWYQQSIDLRKQQNHTPYISAGMLKMARVHFKKDEIAKARSYYDEALKLAHECGRVDVIARALFGIASLDFSQNQRASADSNARQALDLFRRLGMKREQAEAEALLARLAEGSAEAPTP